MERMCFYEFCSELKIFSSPPSTNTIDVFINEVISPILSYKKVKLTDYPYGINPTRVIKMRPIRGDYRESIDISDEMKKKKELERLSEAFSKIKEITLWQVELKEAYNKISELVLSHKDELAKYLKTEDLMNLVSLSENEKKCSEFFALLLMCLICFIPNWSDDEIKIKELELPMPKLNKKLASLLYEELIITSIYCVPGFLEKLPNDTFTFSRIRIWFRTVADMKKSIEECFAYRTQNPYGNHLIANYSSYVEKDDGCIFIMPQTKVCDMSIIRENFLIGPDGRINMEQYKLISQDFDYTKVDVQLEISVLYSAVECYRRIENHIDSCRENMADSGCKIKSIINVEFSSVEDFHALKLNSSLKDMIQDYTKNDVLKLNIYVNYYLKDILDQKEGMLCWILTSTTKN